MTETTESSGGRPWWSRVRAALRRRAGRVGLVTGALIGVVATLLVTTYALPALRDDSLEDGELVILSGVDEGLDDQRQKLIDQWNALGKPKARIIGIGGGATAHHAEMLAYTRAGGLDVDIYNLDVTLMAEFAEFGYIRALDTDGLDLDGFLGGPLETCRRDGQLWGLPFNTDAALLFYRRDILDEPSDVPGSWPALRSIVEAAIDPDPARRAVEAGYASQLADYEGLTVNALEAIWEAGGEVVDDGGDVVIGEEQEGLLRLADGLKPRNPQRILPESREFDEAATTEAFRDGRVLFMRNWPVAYRSLVPDGDPDGTGGDDPGQPGPAAGLRPEQVGVAPLPGPSVLGGQNLAVAANTDQPRAAQELIEFLTTDRSQQLLFERGGFAATREVVYHDPEVIAAYPYAGTLLDAVNRAQPRPETPYYTHFSRVFREGVQHALTHNGRLPDGFADRLDRALHGR